jgi:hypothetical protein
MSANPEAYKYLVRKPKSVYSQLFIKERWIAARTLYGKYAREESPMTPEVASRVEPGVIRLEGANDTTRG